MTQHPLEPAAAPAAPPALLVVMGVSGAGKSTVARLLADHLGCAMLEGDDLHSPRNVSRMAAGIPLTDEDRHDWLDAVAGRLATAARSGTRLVVACSALKRSYRDVLRRGAPGTVFVYLAAPRDVLAERLAARRHHFMPATLLDSQLALLEPPAADEAAVTVDVSQTSADALQAALRALATR